MASGEERVEDAIGAIDGANTSYSTPQAYQAGTLRIFLNGQLVHSDDPDGPTETGPDTFAMALPPLSNDRLRARYVEA